MRVVRFALVSVFFTFIIYASNGYTQWTPDISTNTTVVTAPDDQLDQKIITGDNGSVILAWEDHRNSTSSTNRDIYAQKFDANGIKVWDSGNGLPIAIKPTAERYFDICTDGKGGAFIVWEDYNAAFTITKIKGQRISSAGLKMWSDTGIVITNEGNKQLRPRISYDNNGGFFLAYETSEFNSSEVELKANRLDSNGAKQWSTGVLFCNAVTNQTDLDVTTASDGGFIVSWRDPRSISTEFDIYIQKFTPAGTILWSSNGLAVNTERFEQNYQKVFPDNSGGAFISWTDKRDSIQIDIYAQRVRSDGSFVMQANGKPVCLSPESQFRPRFTTDMKGGVIVTWNDFRNGPSFPFNIDIYAQRIDSAGNLYWTANGLHVCDAPLSQNNQQIISDGSYGAIIGWDDRRNGTSIYDIYAQRVDSSGNLLWNPDDIPVSTATANQYRPMIAPTTGGAVFCFQDTRNGTSNYDLFIQKINNNGTPVTNITGNTYSIPEKYSLYQNYPNPFNPETSISFEIPANEFVKLSVYNSIGQEIDILLRDNIQPGFYEIQWDGSRFGSGVYFYKIETGNFSQTNKMVLIK